MQTLSPALTGHFAEVNTALALCWRLDRLDGVSLGFTQHDRALTLGGLIYRPAPGFDVSAIERTATAAVDNLDLSGAFSSDALTSDDLALGRYDDARLTIFRVNWADLSMGTQYIASGIIGRVSQRDHAFQAELRGLKHRLQERACEDYTPDCRAKLGDKRCRVDLSAFTHRLDLEAQTGSATFTLADNVHLDGYFNFGTLRYMAGPLVGLDAVIVSHTGASITLTQAPTAELTFPLEVRLIAGCDRRLETCISRFDNALNYRGEPHIPGIDSLLNYPGLA
ncbi:MAG: DUF2163 domain-containing protein [Pseudomonadota bacterium]